ncbi:MAG: trypsin-like peptidase domain-containing protein [Burkholderiaceae bacterium]
MRRPALYSSSSRTRGKREAVPAARPAGAPDVPPGSAGTAALPLAAGGAAPERAGRTAGSAASAGATRPPAPEALPRAGTPSISTADAAAAPPTRRARLRRWLASHPRTTSSFAALALVVLALAGQRALNPPPRELTQDDIDAAVKHTLENTVLPSQAARAAAVVAPSVVRVRGFGDDPKEGKETEQSVGSGVVIVDKGIILTNLHVVAQAKRIGLVFADGTESEANVVSIQPENDLAVLQAKTIPDDLVAATMRSTSDLMPGDLVVAVGFPFGIGPSVSSGVISGLQREYQSPEGKRVLTNLIQFDAAVNPGNSGGPLVTAEGEVVGIVTGILNPTQQRVFVGIGFAVPIENAAGAFGLPPF